MNKRFFVCVVFLAVAFAAVAVFLWSKPEPVYQGKPISHWILLAQTSHGGLPRQADPTQDAIFQLGPKAIPYLTDAMGPRPRFKKWLDAIYNRFPPRLRRILAPPVDYVTLRRESARLITRLASNLPLPPGAFDSTVPTLAGALNDTDGRLARASMEALVEIARSETNSPALFALITALTSRHVGVRSGAAYGFTQVGLRRPEALKALKLRITDPAPQVRIDAAHAVYQISGETDRSVEALIRELTGSIATDRGNAASALAQIGPSAKAAVPTLEKMLADPAEYPRGWAEEALRKIDPENSRIPRTDIATLIEGVNDLDDTKSQRAVWALQNMGTAAKPALAALFEALQGPLPRPAYTYAEAIWAIDKTEGPRLINPLINEVRNRKGFQRHAAASLLGRIGIADEAAIHALEGAINERDQRLQQACAFALLKLKSPTGTEEDKLYRILLDGLKVRDDFTVRHMNVVYLRWLGPAARRALPELREARNDPHPMVKQEVENALKEINSIRP